MSTILNLIELKFFRAYPSLHILFYSDGLGYQVRFAIYQAY